MVSALKGSRRKGRGDEAGLPEKPESSLVFGLVLSELVSDAASPRLSSVCPLCLHHSLDAVQFGFVMRLLYKAYACEKMEGGRYLLPGYPAEPGAKRVQEGEKIQVELANGKCLQTTCLKTGFMHLDESVMTHLNLRSKPGLYFVIQVPDDFSPEGVNFGAQVFLDDSQLNTSLNGDES